MNELAIDVSSIEIEKFSSIICDLEKNLNPTLTEIGINIKQYSQKLYEKAICVTLKDDNDVVGLAAFYANNYIEKIAFLSFIAIDDCYVGQGNGRKLLLFCEKIASEKKMNKMRLEVFKQNHSALEFYKAMGYWYYDQNEKVFFMEKRLD